MSAELDENFRPPPPTTNPNDFPSEPVTPSETPTPRHSNAVPESIDVRREEEEEEEEINEDPVMDEGNIFGTPSTPKEEENSMVMHSQPTEEKQEEETIIINQTRDSQTPKRNKRKEGPTALQQTLAKWSLIVSILLFLAAVGCLFAGIVAIVQPVSSWIRTPDSTHPDYTPVWQGVTGIIVGCVYFLNGILAVIAGITVKAQKARIASSIGFVILSAISLCLGFGSTTVMTILRIFVDKSWVAQDPNVTGFRRDRNLLAYLTAGIGGAIILVFCGIFMICGSTAAVLSSYEMYLNFSNASPSHTAAIKKEKRKVYYVQRV
eukprot:gene1286-11371_t